jgi:zinc transport system substrate-binding protein
VRRCIVVILILLLSLYVPNVFAAEKIPIFVSIVPQMYFAEKIGGDYVSVMSMTAQGADVHTFEPKPKQMTDLAKAKVYFAIGVEFEDALLGKIASVNHSLMIVHTEQGIAKIPMKAHHHEGKETHHHGDERGDPHVWLSPTLVKVQADAIFKALVSADPNHKAAYEANYAGFVKEIDALDTELKAIFSKAGKNNKFMVFHPSWGYFAKNYGLEQIPVEIEGKEPKPAELQELITHAKADDIRVVFAQPQYSSKNAEVIAKAINGQVIMVDSLSKDWADNLRQVAQKFKAALK